MVVRVRADSPADWNRFESALASVERVVGCTLLIRLERVTHEVGPPVYVKLESHSPTGSSKDRPYLFMFSEAEARGELRAGMTVLEAATGSSGVACAFMAARKGYKCRVI